MSILNADQHRSFIAKYGMRIFNHINEVIENRDFERSWAIRTYLSEIGEEIFFRRQSVTLIGTKLYGLTHNTELNSLDMNYLTPQELALRNLSLWKIRREVNIFRSKMERGFHSDLISDIPAVFMAIERAMGETPDHLMRLNDSVPPDVTDSETEDMGVPLSPEQVLAYVDSHNKMVEAHLNFRANSNISISEYRTCAQVCESKSRLIFQKLDAMQARVFAAFVFLDAREGRYTRADVEDYTGLSRTEIAETLDWLCDNLFLSRYPRQKYNSTEIVFTGLTPEEARDILYASATVPEEEVVPAVDSTEEALVDLTWHEALLYDAIQKLGGPSGTLQIGGDQLVLFAFRGHYASSGGYSTEAITSLEGRGLVERNTGTKPYSYIFPLVHEEETIFANVRDEDYNDLQMILDRDPVDISVTNEQDVVTVTREVPTAEVQEQSQATNELETLMDNVIHQRLAMLNPELAQLVLQQGSLSLSHDEESGTTTITFSYTPDTRW